MTRDEEIINAGINYTLQTYPVCIGGDNFSEQMRDFNRNKSFEAGAKWADEHPNLSSLWHDANEEPQGNNWKILCQDEMNGCWVENRVDAILLHNTWNEYAEIEMIVKWAYTKDLILKIK